MPRPYGLIHIASLALVGAAGWLLLLWLTLVPEDTLRVPEPNWELGACLLLVGGARLLAFRIHRRARIALDSAFYVAARFVFGTIAAAWLLVITLTLDAAVNLTRGEGPVPRGEAPLRHTLAYVAYSGGLPTLVLIAVSAALGEPALPLTSDTSLYWRLPVFSVCFLVSHYVLAGGAAWLTGTYSSNLWHSVFLRPVGAELTLVPLTLAMVLAYKHQGPSLFFLLGATGLLFGGIFRRWTIASDKLQDRVDELQAINRIGRVIADSNERSELFRNLSVASLQLVGQGSLFMIGLLEDDEESISYELYDAQGACTKQLVAQCAEGLAGWVMMNNQGLVLGDLANEYLLYANNARYFDPQYRSWLGVPLVVYGEVIGVMSVQSERADAYNLSHLRVLATIADQASVAIENSRLYQLATVDGLTGLFVRRYFDQRLVEEWHRADRYGSPFTLGLFDLDRFKMLNDTYGHQFGDQVLRAAGKAVRDNMRSFDLAARYGGEEFAFILPRTTLEEAQMVAERIRADVERIEVEASDGIVHVTTSIGIVTFPNDSIEGPTEMVNMADEALYRAKSSGRNRVVAATGKASSTDTSTVSAG